MQIRLPPRCPLLVGGTFGGGDRFALAIEIGVNRARRIVVVHRPSAVGQALLAVGDQWTLLILQRALLGRARRFADWRDDLHIAESVLASRLREMVARDLLLPKSYTANGRTRPEYMLSPRAIDLWPMFVAIWSWERAWVARPNPLPDLIHDTCGQSIDVELGCGACGKWPTAGADIQTAYDAGIFAQVAVPRLHRRTVRPDASADPLSYFPETLAIIADRWSTVVLAAAFVGVRRFADFQETLGVAPSVLSARLRLFTDLGVLEAADDAAGESRGYWLTPKGLAFSPTFVVLIDWANRWYNSESSDSKLTIIHRRCGATLVPQLRCRTCGDVVDRTNIHFWLPPRA
jgi:DNA-binding HxlR family transcriptional regulator